ncbi:MAG TPA: OmpH family outer membrane protein [Sedimentisphaerales bacterium]|nr:OmpH family outer membrane protein [Sedimentisphaerales bacterium]HNU29252.1 OmpH family outer membrane protein [Sedimentisphaerales bacterium]
MNGKMAVGGVMVCALALLAVLDHGRAASQPAGPTSRIGVVSMSEMFAKSQKHTQHNVQAMARLSQGRAQLENLRKEVDGEEAELKTLREGTADYAQQLQVLIEKRSRLQGQQDFLKQQSMLDEKKWREDLYQVFMKVAQEIAKEKGLDLVLERSEPAFPISSEELMLTLYTHKVLYAGGCIDLTSEVIARIDADATLKP